MKIIRDNTKNETIVTCPKCKSIFIYTDDDLNTDEQGLPKVICPCCNEEEICWNLTELLD